MLLQQIHEVDISEQEFFPNAKWEEYLAILSLAALGRLCSLFKRTGEITEETLSLTAVAMEAITIAEAQNFAIPTLAEGRRKRISLRRRRSGSVLYEDIDPVKKAFNAWYADHYLPSLGGENSVKKDAAEQYFREHASPADQAALGKFDNPTRILVDSLPVTPRPRTDQ